MDVTLAPPVPAACLLLLHVRHDAIDFTLDDMETLGEDSGGEMVVGAEGLEPPTFSL
jgi:hypothetical protein